MSNNQYTHEQAELVARNLQERFPALEIADAMDVKDNETGEYQWSFVGVWFDKQPIVNIGNGRKLTAFLKCCQHVASQLEEEVHITQAECSACGRFGPVSSASGLCEGCTLEAQMENGKWTFRR